MFKTFREIWLAAPLLALAAALVVPTPASAQQTPGAPALPAATVCGQQRAPLAQPPADSPPVVLFIAPCFEAQGGTSVIEPQTYIYYIQLKASTPSQGVWIPYD